jgi:Domain of Unknown Function (DUF1080)
MRTPRRLFVFVAVIAAAIGLRAQQPPAGQAPAGQPPAGQPGQPGQRPPGGVRPSMPEALVLDAHDGFESIFDGKTMTNWDGDPSHWRAENGELIGETTTENPLKVNTFAIWRGGRPKDFELKVEYKMNATNSGVQYRSVELPEIARWVLKGYQADIDFDNRYTGQLYEERGRGFLALRGQATYIPDGQKPRIIGNLESADALKAFIKVNDWNQFHVIARGNTLVHILNGHVTTVVVDDDTKNRADSGLLGFQLHMGPPMKAEFRNIWLKTTS